MPDIPSPTLDLQGDTEELFTRDRPGDPITEPASSAIAPVVSPCAVLPDAARYEDWGSIARGGMGEVRRIFDRRLERSLVLKCMLPGLARVPAARSRFRTESLITAGLQHPSIVSVFDCGELPDGRLWYTMQELSGARSLAEVLRGPDRPRALPAFLSVVSALAHAHSRGVIHRDLKPDNVLLGDWEEVLVIDWGIARRQAAPEAKLVLSEADGGTQLGACLGTPPYLSPEQANGQVEHHGPWSDVWSLGVMLFEVLTGQTPYPRSMASLYDLRAGRPPLDITTTERKEGGPVPRPLAELVLSCLRADPERRPPSAAALLEPLRAYLEAQERRARALELWEAATRQAQEPVEARARAHTLEREARALLDPLPAHAPVEEKQVGWRLEDAAAAEREAAVLAEVRREQTLRAALELDPTVQEAHEALADLYQARLVEAEAIPDRVAATRAEALLRQHDRGRYARWLQGDGAFSLHTDPSGATVAVYRYETIDRRLVPVDTGRRLVTPIAAFELPRGSYLALIHSPGRPPVRYPFVIGRGEHWDGIRPGERSPLAIPVPGTTELGPDDVYVPPGFAWIGDPLANLGEARRRLWIDGFIMRRHPVTNAEYLRFLDELDAAGTSDDLLALMPRESAGPLDPLGSSPYVRRPEGGFTTQPDSQGHHWQLDLPVVLVTWTAASRWCAAEASLTGQPWRLPWELEREKAARGVDGRTYPWGEQGEPTWFRCRQGQTGSPTPAPVSAYPGDTSPYELRGAAGNIRDWCLDLRNPTEPHRERDGLWARPPLPDPGDESTWRMGRGGGWSLGLEYGRCGTRAGAPAGFRHSVFGFRAARSWPT